MTSNSIHSSDILSKFSNIHVFYVFSGFLKNTWKYLIQRPIFKPLYFYNVFLKILENTFFWAPSKNTRISYVTTMTQLLTHTYTTQITSRSTFDAQTNHGQTWIHKIHHGLNFREATTFPITVYFVPGHRTSIQMSFCLGTPKWES
jgi:hypothetical protein